MSRRLQAFDHRSSSYERPDREWVCGHAAEGRPCRLGPDARGRCRAGTMCAPARQGEIWICTLREGPCEEGPLPDGRCCRTVPPCVPRRSWGARQKRLSTWVAVFALGLLALGLAPERRSRVASPGDLTRPHRLIESCSSCHAGWEEGPQEWVVAAMDRDPGVEDADCLACHRLGDGARTAHGLPRETLADLGERAASRPARTVDDVRRTLVGPDDAYEPPRCAVCHREHRGVEGTLTRVADARCQICHHTTFRSFSDGHPEFATYPSTEATAIVFDHRRHLERHFEDPAVEGRAPTSCGDCHRVDRGGLRMTVLPFASTCGSCHLSWVDGRDRPSGTRAIEVLNVPGLDSRTLEEAGLAVGDWPWLAEDRPTPWLALLLAEGDPAVARSLEGVDLLDLRDADPEVLVAAARLAWNVKRIYGLLVLEGTDAVARRLSERLAPLPEGQLPHLVQGLSRATLAEAVDEWFPNLESELSRLESGAVSFVPRQTEPRGVPSEDGEPAGPAAEEDDDLLAEGAGDDLLVPDESGGGSGDDLLAGDDDLLAEETGDDLLAPDGNGGGFGDDLLAGDDDLLAEETGDDLLAPDGDGGGSEDDLLAGDDDLLAGDDDLLAEGAGDDLLGPGEDGGGSGDDLLADDPASASDADRPEGAAAPSRDPVDPEEWARRGGWFVRDTSIFYRPAAHPDPFLAAWIDLASRRTENPNASHLFETAMDPEAPGGCARCHSIDATGGRPRVRWEPTAPERGRSAFTRFPHRSHFSVASGLNGCEACHRLRRGVDALASWDDRDPSTFVPAFDPAPRDLCASCHQATAVGDACTSCHLYHAGERPTTTPPLSLLAAADGGDIVIP